MGLRLRGSCGEGYNTLVFRYTVQPPDRDVDGISIAVDGLALNGGSIRSASGTDAELDLGSQAVVNDQDHKVDGRRTIPVAAVDSVWIRGS